MSDSISSIIVQDSRLINLNSQDAIRLNGDKLSNILFPIKNLIKDDPNMLYSTIGVLNAQVAVSWYLINSSNCFLYVTVASINYTLELTKGNYNYSSLSVELITEFQAIGVDLTLSINKINGILTFVFNTTVTLLAGTPNLFRILGFDNVDYIGITIIAPFPLNLLGIKKLKINSSYLATNSYDSSNTFSSDTIETIPVDVPSFGLITFLNQTSTYGKMRMRRIDTIDLQILDQYNNFVEFNNIDFSITLKLIIFRTHQYDTGVLAISPLDTSLPLPSREKQLAEKGDEKVQEPMSDLNFLQYNNKK